jgi:tryptophan synthase beta chain
MNYDVDEEGYFGGFGGAFIPEMLYRNVNELAGIYREVIERKEFQRSFQDLLTNYVGRPSPLYYGEGLSRRYSINLFIKREDLNHTGSHKITNVLGQILIARHLGKSRIIAETGAGQHGVATATAAAKFGLPCVIYMGEVDVARQDANVRKMRMLGATVVPVSSGSRTLKDATNEAMRDWIANPESTHYIIGSAVGPHPFPDMVARLQSVIGNEVADQLMSRIGREYPDVAIACVGGGSNAIGLFSRYLNDERVTLVAVEAAGHGIDSGHSAATTALGTPGVLHGSRTILMQSQDGQVLEAHCISAGLDYPGIGPQHAHLHTSGRAQYVHVTDDEAVSAALLLARTEGIIPALESAHAFAWLEKGAISRDSVVVINCSGSGEKDMRTYLSYAGGDRGNF